MCRRPRAGLVARLLRLRAARQPQPSGLWGWRPGSSPGVRSLGSSRLETLSRPIGTTCVAALEEAIAQYGRPDIFTTDQGSQFTSFAFTNTLKAAGIRISMDGRGRWMDNVFIERLWRSLKYECVFLNAFETGSEARTGIGRWIGYYNASRPHSSFGGRTPNEVYAIDSKQEKLAA
jgi:transposase InsO family protein